MDSGMSFQSSTPMTIPTFFLYRTAGLNDAFDPTAEIQFYPPKDSDDLFDALRSAYPVAKTHSERMRNAVIDFLVKERDAEQAKNNMASTPSTLSSWPSNSTSSTFSSPDLIDLATPASAASPMPVMSRQPSRASTTGKSSMEQMTNVFSLSADSQPKTRVRRKMTESEKAEYRKRRIVKACDKCSRRKRKCEHNQERMEVINSCGKVTKRKSPSNTALPFKIEQLAAPPSFTTELDPLSFLTDDSLFSLQEPSVPANLNVMDFDFGPQTAQAEAWPWSDTQDWTLMDAPSMHDTVQIEPLFGELTGYNNQNDMNSHATERQPSTHTLQAHSSHPVAVMGSTVNPELLQTHRTPNEIIGISAMNMGLVTKPDLMYTDEDPGSGGDMLSPAGLASYQPTHGRRYYGGFEAFNGASQHGPSTRLSETLLPDAPLPDSPLLHGRAVTLTRRARPGTVVKDNAVASSSSSNGSFHNEEDWSDSGHGQGLRNGGARVAVASQQSVTKNRGPEHASRASAAAAGLGDGKVDVVIATHMEGNGREVPTLNIGRQQGGNVMKPSSYQQAAAERSLSNDVATPQRGYAHIAPALLHDFDFDFNFTVTEAASSSSTHTAGLRRLQLSGEPNSGLTTNSSSGTARSTTLLSSELIHAFSSHNSAPEARNKHRLVPADSATSTTPMAVTAELNKGRGGGADEGPSSLPNGGVSDTPTESSRSVPRAPRPSPAGSNTSSRAIQPAASLAAHLPRTPLSAKNNNNASNARQELLSGSAPTRAGSAPLSNESLTSRHNDARTPPPSTAQPVQGASATSAAPTPTPPFSAMLRPAKNRRIPAHNTDADNDDSHAERRPYPPLPSGTRGSHGKAGVVSAVLSASASPDTGKAHAGLDAAVAVATVSLMSSGYLLGLAQALAGELLKGMMMQRGQMAGAKDQMGVSRGLRVRDMLACV